MLVEREKFKSFSKSQNKKAILYILHLVEELKNSF